MTYRNEDAALALLHCRKLPAYGRRTLVEKFIGAEWLQIWPVSAPEVEPLFAASRWGGFNHLMRKALERGKASLLAAILGSFAAVPLQVTRDVIQEAFEAYRDDLANAIMVAPAVRPHVDQALLRCFSHALWAQHEPLICKRKDLAMHLLEFGVRPLRSLDPEDFLGPHHRLIEERNLPVLRRALEFEPPTREIITKLLSPGLGASFQARTGTLDYLVGISRRFPGHGERMSAVAFSTAVYFLHQGVSSALMVIQLMLEEGGTLVDTPAERIEKVKPYVCRGIDEQGFWIDLITELTRGGYPADVRFIKELKPPRKPNHGRLSKPARNDNLHRLG